MTDPPGIHPVVACVSPGPGVAELVPRRGLPAPWLPSRDPLVGGLQTLGAKPIPSINACHQTAPVGSVDLGHWPAGSGTRLNAGPRAPSHPTHPRVQLIDVFASAGWAVPPVNHARWVVAENIPTRSAETNKEWTLLEVGCYGLSTASGAMMVIRNYKSFDSVPCLGELARPGDQSRPWDSRAIRRRVSMTSM